MSSKAVGAMSADDVADWATGAFDDATVRVLREGVRAELEGMRVMELFRRASSDSALDADKVEQAMDSDDAKTALISLLLAQHGGADPQAAEAAAKAKAREALRAELQGLRVMELFKRATSSGVDTARTEDAMDSDDPKAALTALLLEAAS